MGAALSTVAPIDPYVEQATQTGNLIVDPGKPQEMPGERQVAGHDRLGEALFQVGEDTEGPEAGAGDEYALAPVCTCNDGRTVGNGAFGDPRDNMVVGSRKDPTDTTSNPADSRCRTIRSVTSAVYGVTTPMRLTPRAANAATAAVMGLVQGTPGWAELRAASIPASPMSVAADVQPYPMASSPSSTGSRAAARGNLFSIAVSESGVMVESLAMRDT